MNLAMLNSLTEEERLFVDAASRKALADLDEDQVVDLHARARRMRDKYVSAYRRSAAAAVAERGGRGVAYVENTRDREKAEVFETVLSGVSRRLGVLAQESAARLREERIEAARATTAAAPDPGLPEPAPLAGTAPLPKRKTPALLKREAHLSSLAARRQAQRDSRRVGARHG